MHPRKGSDLMTYEMTLWGITKSKKNSYTPTRGGMFKNSALKAELDSLEQQVPGDMRDLNLEHPDITFQFHSRSSRRDKDGLMTTVLDVLKRCGVIVDDNISHCDGTLTILPSVIGDEDSAHVTIITKEL